MSLRDTLRRMKGAGIISSIVDKYLATRPDDFREAGWHVSQICMMCPRAKQLSVFFAKASPAPKDVFSERIFDLGKAIHSIYQNWYLGPAGVLWGKWECTVCQQVVWGLRPSMVCCKDSFWKYKEVPVRLPAVARVGDLSWYQDAIAAGKKPEDIAQDIVGHSDALIWHEDMQMWLSGEFKSCKSEVFQYQVASSPMESHERQSNIYGTLKGLGFIDGVPEGVEVPVPERKVILYVNKNTSEEREFLSPIDRDVAYESFFAVTEFEKGRQLGTLALMLDDCRERGKKAPRAKRCSSESVCFASWVDDEYAKIIERKNSEDSRTEEQ
jgi:hypothetical protein